MNKEVLYVSYDGMTDPLGQSQVIPYISGLSRLGYNITLISCEKKDRYERYGNAIQKQLTDAGIEWHHFYFSTRPPLLSKFWDVSRLKKKAAKLHKAKSFSIVHCRSYMASMVGMHLKKKHGVKFIFDMRGFWADERIDGAVWSLKNPVYKYLYNYFKQFEKKCLLSADASICLTRNGIKEMLRWKYVNKEVASKIHHITTCCDIASFNETFQKRKSRAFNTDSIQFVYIGSIGPWHSFDKLSAFIKAIHNHIPGSFFKLIVSSGQEEMEKFIAENNLDRSRFELKFVPHKNIPDELVDADIAFFFIPHQYSKIASSPTKMGEMLSAGLPVITGSQIGDVDELITTNNIGTIVESFTENEIAASAAKVVQLCSNDKQGLMDRCRYTAEDYFSLDNGIKKYAEIYAALV